MSLPAQVTADDSGHRIAYRPIANIEAEAALIGAMLQANQIVDEAADTLRTDDFFEPLHQRLFAAAVQMVAQGKAATPVTLKPLFENDEAIDQLGGISYLAKLTADGSGLLMYRQLIQQVREYGVLRRMQVGFLTAAEACSGATETGDPFPDVLAEITAHVDSALDHDKGDAATEVSASRAVESLINELRSPVSGVTCGRIPELDRLLGPINRKDMVILAARPGMGKTAAAISYSVGAARAGHGVLFISLEMSASQLAGRIAADWCFTHGDNSVPYAAITGGQISEWQLRKVGDACGAMVTLPLEIVDTGQLTLGQLNARIKRWVRRFAARGQRLDLVVVDYLQLMRSGHKTGSKYEDVSEVSNGLKRIAKDHDLGVMALCQLSREVEKRHDKRPILADLRDSGSIEQDADSVIFLLRDEYYLDQARPDEASPKFFEWQNGMEAAAGRIEFIAAKRRNGRTGTAIGAFHGAYQAVR